MKILVPYCPDAAVSDYEPYRKQIEIYGGFSDELWNDDQGSGYGLNRMSSFGSGANFKSFDEWVETLYKLAEAGIPTNIVFNGFYYDQHQAAFIAEHYLMTLSKVRRSGIITGSIPLIRAANTLGLRTSVSTIGNVYNAYIAAAYEREFAESVILPRELTVEEITEIIKRVPKLEYEAFILGSGCRFSDGSCMCTHIPRRGGMCQMLDMAHGEVAGKADFHEESIQRLSFHAFHGLFMKDACGLCALYRLINAGVTKFKIVGRSEGFRSVRNMLEQTVTNLEIAMNCQSEEEYLRNMKIDPHMASRCVEGYNCYYPEIRFPR